MGAWINQVHGRAVIVIEQLEAARGVAAKHGVSATDASRPYFEMLQEIYEEELPWAQLMDDSDLVVRMRGPAVDRPSPVLSAVSGAFTDIREQIGRVARAIIGLSVDVHARGHGIDLALSGIARGSLVVGVRVIRPSESGRGDTPTIFGDNDPLYLSVREAVRQLAVVTQHVSENGLDEGIKESIPDPAVRDALTVATQRLAPSGKRGIEEVTLYSPGALGQARPLTPNVRRALSVSLKLPIKAPQRGKFEGDVREIDLDARRFELRRVKGGISIRCIYPESMSGRAAKWLDRRVRVAGFVERAPSGDARLLDVQTVAMLRDPQRKLPLKARAD